MGLGRAHAHARVRARAGVARARPRARAHRKHRLAADVAASEAAHRWRTAAVAKRDAAAGTGRERTRAT